MTGAGEGEVKDKREAKDKREVNDKGDKVFRGALKTDETGAVSVFLLLTGVAVLTLFLAVFNYGRFLMAQRQTELALEASLNSVLSYYNKDLAREMGLFAFDAGDTRLRDIGREYFIDNLGGAGAVNGQTCLSYSVSYPEESRLDISGVITGQAVDLKRIDGWIGIVGDILEMIGVHDLKSLWSLTDVDTAIAGEGIVSGEVGALAGEVDPDAALDAFYERVDSEEKGWIERFEDFRREGGGRLRIWNLLSSTPPEGTLADRSMPAEISRLGYLNGSGFVGDPDFWGDMFSDPRHALGGIIFLPDAFGQVCDFVSEIKEGIPAALNRGYNKTLLVEYILNEMDFITNKPIMNRYFARAEVEYILCGRVRSWNNIREMALKLLILRSCLYLLDLALHGRVEDLFTFAAALVESVIRGAIDVEKLYAGNRIPAYPGWTRVDMSYKDHLRLFLSLKNEEALRKATRELTQVNLWYWAGSAGSTDGLGGSGGAGGAGDAGSVSGSGSAGIVGGAGVSDADIFGGFGSIGGAGSSAGLPRSPADFTLDRFATEVQAIVETELSIWPFGSVKIKREGMMGYDKPFTLLSQE